MRESLVQISTAFGVFWVLVFLQSFGILNPVLDATRVSLNYLTKPPVFILERSRDIALAFFSVQALVRQNQILARQLENLSSELALSEQARQENKILREALGFQAERKLDLVAAEIIAYDYLNFDQKAVLNRGQDHGLAIGHNVVAAPGALVGIITGVSAKTSEMELVTSSNMVVGARTTDSSAAGVVRGEHGLGLLFDQVSQTEQLKPGARVVSSGSGGKFLAGLYLGEVAEVKSGSSELFQTASLKPAVDFRSLSVVFAIKK